MERKKRLTDVLTQNWWVITRLFPMFYLSNSQTSELYFRISLIIFFSVSRTTAYIHSNQHRKGWSMCSMISHMIYFQRQVKHLYFLENLFKHETIVGSLFIIFGILFVFLLNCNSLSINWKHTHLYFIGRLYYCLPTIKYFSFIYLFIFCVLR